MRGGDRQTEEVGSGKSLARYFIDVRRIPNDGVEARHGRALRLNVDSRPHPGKQALKSHRGPFDERYIVAHAPKLLIIGYVHALLSSRATLLIMPPGSHIWHRKLSKAH
jgi:hypothetical protein